jgi:hypothetical protein
MRTGDRISFIASAEPMPPSAWNALAGRQPFVRHSFFRALHDSGSVGPRTGWTPRFLSLQRAGAPVAALALYEKTHSMGEFVFDWTWAEAYHRAGLSYYPKLVTAVPFTPVPGTRLLSTDAPARAELIDAAIDHARRSGQSSWHVLFAREEEAEALADRGLLLRHGVQFHWRNDGYRDFQDFLDRLSRDKRKKVRQERRRVADAGIALRRLAGSEITPELWRFFYRCYSNTYAQRGRPPYLNPDFFERLGAAMPENLLLVLALREGREIAAALNVLDDERLYGRYWGALEYVPALHFEVCYYQGIEVCIERGLLAFEGGAQGEHKLARGLMPVRTCSAHWIRDARFADAIGRHLARESEAIEAYIEELMEHAPFR